MDSSRLSLFFLFSVDRLDLLTNIDSHHLIIFLKFRSILIKESLAEYYPYRFSCRIAIWRPNCICPSSFPFIIQRTILEENYILECLRSIQMQDFRDYEILLIDDCSSDNTPAICSEQSKKDNRIKYIRREKNDGTSAARNTGIHIAQGDYITFTDNDDFWRIPHAPSACTNWFVTQAIRMLLYIRHVLIGKSAIN